jgi:hypothetical protein
MHDFVDKEEQPQRRRAMVNAVCADVIGEDVQYVAVRRNEYMRLHFPDQSYSSQPEFGYSSAGMPGSYENAKALADSLEGDGWVVEPWTSSKFCSRIQDAVTLVSHVKNRPEFLEALRDRLPEDTDSLSYIFTINPIHIAEAFAASHNSNVKLS